MLKKRAQSDISSYLLGGKKIPWYMLGLSNASGMFDISGTMWLVTLIFVYGLKSIWIPWLWPVFNQVFLMMYLSAWLRRSNVTTGAEWISFRFGNAGDGRLSHAVVVVFALIICLGFLAYGFIGLGKFVQIFIPWELFSDFVPFDVPPHYVPHIYGIAFTSFAVFYSIMGGMSGIVWADVVQYLIMTVSAIVIAVIAIAALDGQTLNVPDGWMSPFFKWKLDLDWNGIIHEVNDKIKADGYSLFSVFFSMMLFKGVLVSLAGPAPNYDMQKILSTGSPKEAAKMSGFVSVVLLPVRYLMIAGFAVLAILHYDKLNLLVAGKIDFEQILPSAISAFVPVGFMGLLLAGLLAAFMSTFAGTLNAAQAYIVNDLYLKYYNKKATNKQIKTTNYVTGLLVVVISIVFGFFAGDVNSILQWIVSALFGSYVASNVLKWHWWRFNGSGFFWGMVAGLVPALLFPYIFSETLDLYYFPLLLLLSVAGCIIGTYLSKPTDDETLMNFYKKVRPWGFWKPIHDKVVAEDPSFTANKDFGKDMLNVIVGIVAQTCLVVIPIYLVLGKHLPMAITIGITIVCAVILKKTWWNKLDENA
ncbi:sodium:solute symporter family protein [Saccharicrinis carchari]|uniref:sodium:solute symporter family protein n=1 Tax=Saccharicrinis carchari TaxID=1168039 RepID=UPI001C8F9018|nr:sodium:solute symporter family protein [Saccharicrinis carchari]